MKKLLILLMAFSLFTACNSDKGKYKPDDKNADYRDKDDYNSNEDDRKNDDRDKEESNSNDGWPEKDRRKFLADCMTGFENNEAMGKQLCPCVLEKLEKKYASLTEGDAKGGEAEGKRMATACLETIKGGSDDENDNENDKSDYSSVGWSRSEENKFVEECASTASKNVGEERGNQYCKCMLNKMKKQYPTYAEAERALGRMTQEQINRIAEDCN